MKQVDVTISNRAGLHARPATKIVQITSAYPCETQLCYKGESANAKSIMGIIALGITYNETVTLIADGPQEDVVIEKLTQLFQQGFHDE